MRKTLVAITLSLLLVAALGLTALGAAPVKGGTLKVAVTSIQQLGLYKSASNDENDATSLIFDQLFVIGKKEFQPIPHLAESWDNPDPLTWVFHIRKGTMFHDDNVVFPKGKSREVTADDVVYSVNRMIKLSTSFVLGPIKSVKALDRYTVEIKTETPQPFLVNDSNRLARMSVVPKEAIDKLGEDGFAKTPIGSGPFKFKSFSPDSGLVIVRNDLYWPCSPERYISSSTCSTSKSRRLSRRTRTSSSFRGADRTAAWASTYPWHPSTTSRCAMRYRRSSTSTRHSRQS